MNNTTALATMFENQFCLIMAWATTAMEQYNRTGAPNYARVAHMVVRLVKDEFDRRIDNPVFEPVADIQSWMTGDIVIAIEVALYIMKEARDRAFVETSVAAHILAKILGDEISRRYPTNEPDDDNSAPEAADDETADDDSDPYLATINLSNDQVEIAEWVIDAMESMSEADYEELGYTVDDLPELIGKELMILNSDHVVDVIKDFLYRIEQHSAIANDAMRYEGSEQAVGVKRACTALRNKLIAVRLLSDNMDNQGEGRSAG